MELLDQPDFSVKEAEESIRDIADENKLLALVTVSEGQEAFNATAFYAFDDDLNFYILTEPNTDHCKNLRENSSISLSIYDSHQDWGDEKKGLQVFGKAEQVPEEEIPEVLELYLERFPELGEWVSEPGEMDSIDSQFYVIRPEKIKIFDEPRFGKETWVNVGF
ncbi:MAG: pyridoxamine 5'-phosphate oxidase family protein [Candidatus Nanosalina sp.]